MNTAKVYLHDGAAWRAFYTADGQLQMAQAAQDLMDQGAYHCIGDFETHQQGQLAAEDMFDLSNNPSRDGERGLRWGPNRSLSVGDIVETGADRWLCASIGWQQI
jgi:hypothetical protein